MHDANPTDQMIQQGFLQMAPELSKRYGIEGGCTHQQVIRTATDLKIADNVVPYLSTVFLTDAELPVFRATNNTVNWEEVNKRADRIYRGLLHTTGSGAGFHESWKGVYGM